MITQTDTFNARITQLPFSCRMFGNKKSERSLDNHSIDYLWGKIFITFKSSLKCKFFPRI